MMRTLSSTKEASKTILGGQSAFQKHLSDERGVVALAPDRLARRTRTRDPQGPGLRMAQQAGLSRGISKGCWPGVEAEHADSEIRTGISAGRVEVEVILG